MGADADEEDDEATLDEEAALDAAAGRDVKVCYLLGILVLE